MLIVPKKQGKCWKFVLSQIGDAIKYNSRLSGDCNCLFVFPTGSFHILGLIARVCLVKIQLESPPQFYFLSSGFFTVLTHAVILSRAIHNGVTI